MNKLIIKRLIAGSLAYASSFLIVYYLATDQNIFSYLYISTYINLVTIYNVFPYKRSKHHLVEDGKMEIGIVEIIIISVFFIALMQIQEENIDVVMIVIISTIAGLLNSVIEFELFRIAINFNSIIDQIINAVKGMGNVIILILTINETTLLLITCYFAGLYVCMYYLVNIITKLKSKGDCLKREKKFDLKFIRSRKTIMIGLIGVIESSTEFLLINSSYLFRFDVSQSLLALKIFNLFISPYSWLFPVLTKLTINRKFFPGEIFILIVALSSLTVYYGVWIINKFIDIRGLSEIINICLLIVSVALVGTNSIIFRKFEIEGSAVDVLKKYINFLTIRFVIYSVLIYIGLASDTAILFGIVLSEIYFFYVAIVFSTKKGYLT